MPDSPQTTWRLAFARELRQLRPYLSQKLAETIGTSRWAYVGRQGDPVEAARAYHAETGGPATKAKS